MEQLRSVRLNDPVSGRQVEALTLLGPQGLEATLVPERALDIYSLRFSGTQMSYTRRDKGIAPENFVEDGARGFSRNFFAGLVTTCGLIQSGRPCEENGRAFGLHGRISNTPALRVEAEQGPDGVRVRAVTEEVHEQGERMRLERTVSVGRDDAALTIRDRVTNIGAVETPFMMMYHMNFGAPFLSEKLSVQAEFLATEDRDTGRPEEPSVILAMGKPESMRREKVYYTRVNRERGVVLDDARTGIVCRLTARGEGLDWLGVWKDFTPGVYALGIEPCNCPGLGRVGARARGLLPRLLPGESREHLITVSLTKS